MATKPKTLPAELSPVEFVLVTSVREAREKQREWHALHSIAEMIPTEKNRTRAANAERAVIRAKEVAHAAYVEAVRV